MGYPRFSRDSGLSGAGPLLAGPAVAGPNIDPRPLRGPVVVRVQAVTAGVDRQLARGGRGPLQAGARIAVPDVYLGPLGVGLMPPVVVEVAPVHRFVSV